MLALFLTLQLLVPQSSGGNEAAHRPIEAFGSRAALQVRLDVERRMRQGDESLADDAVALVAQPREHWERVALAFELFHLAMLHREPRALADALEPIRAELIAYDVAPFAPVAFEQWVKSRYPCVDPGRVLACAGIAVRQGRLADAADWYSAALSITPVTEGSFLSALHGLVSLALRGAPSPALERALDEVSGGTLHVGANLQRMEPWLAALASLAPDLDPTVATKGLLDAGIGGRVELAVRLMQGTAQPDDGMLALDHAALLARSALLRLAADPTDAAGEAALTEALALAPSPPQAAAIAAELLFARARANAGPELFFELIERLTDDARDGGAALRDNFVTLVELLCERDRAPLAAELCDRLLARLGDHAWRPAVLLTRARLEPDREEAATLLRAAVACAGTDERSLRPLQLEALADLASTCTLLGREQEALETAARLFALGSGPDPERITDWEERTSWIARRVTAGASNAEVAADAVAFLLARPPAPALRSAVVARFLARIVGGGARAALAARLAGARQDCARCGDAEGAAVIAEAQLQCAEGCVELAELLTDFSSERLVTDEELFAALRRTSGAGAPHASTLLLNVVVARPLERGPPGEVELPSDLVLTFERRLAQTDAPDEMEALAEWLARLGPKRRPHALVDMLVRRLQAQPELGRGPGLSLALRAFTEADGR